MRAVLGDLQRLLLNIKQGNIKKMATSEERLAVLESKDDRRASDISALFTLIRTHMEKEEEDRQVLIKELVAIKVTQQRQKSFVGGIVFTISAVWAAALAIVFYIKP